MFSLEAEGRRCGILWRLGQRPGVIKGGILWASGSDTGKSGTEVSILRSLEG